MVKKEKTIEKARKDAENDYQGGGAYRAFLEMFYKNKIEEDKKMDRKTAKTFRILSMLKRCRQENKFKLYLHLLLKYNIDKEKLEEAYYD